jgi:hypothetical protein
MRWPLFAILVLGLVVPAASANARRQVPRGWVGVNLEPDRLVMKKALDAEFARMARSGVESVRVAVYWRDAQPYPSKARVPSNRRRAFRVIDGVPTDFSLVDRLVRRSARHRLPLLPVVLGAPAWAAADRRAPIPIPRDPGDYARFVAALVHRYGPAGSFWAENPRVRRLPVRRWQIWNEVSNPWYWPSSWPSAYPRLLRAGYDAIKRSDRGATVLMAGLNTGGAGGPASYPSWDALELIYRQLDSQRLGRPFDVVGAHIYTRRVSDALRVVEETRRVMASHGDGRRRLDVTELAWPAAKGKLRDARGHRREFFAATDDRGQARRLVEGLRLLARNRVALRIGGVSWFQWASDYSGHDDAFRYSGLRRAGHGKIVDTPSMASFRTLALRLEGRGRSARQER